MGVQGGGFVAVPGGEHGGVVNRVHVVDVIGFGRFEAGGHGQRLGVALELHEIAQVRGRDVVFGEDVHGVVMGVDDDVFEAVVARPRAGGWIGRLQGQRFDHPPGDQGEQHDGDEDFGFGKRRNLGVVWERGAAIGAAPIAVVGQLAAFFTTFHFDYSGWVLF